MGVLHSFKVSMPALPLCALSLFLINIITEPACSTPRFTPPMTIDHDRCAASHPDAKNTIASRPCDNNAPLFDLALSPICCLDDASFSAFSFCPFYPVTPWRSFLFLMMVAMPATMMMPAIAIAK